MGSDGMIRRALKAGVYFALVLPALSPSPALSGPAFEPEKIVNPLDYGAKCDGSTDNSTAFQVALNTHGHVVSPAGKNCVVGNLTIAGSGQVFDTHGGTLTAVSGSKYIIGVGAASGAFEPRVSGFYLNDNGATVSQTTLASGINTYVGSASVATGYGGTGGSAGACTVTGTTGTGTKLQATGTVTGGALGGTLTISVAGSYSVNPTNPRLEPVTGCSLTGAKLFLNMTSSGSISVTSASNGPGVLVGQRYSILETNGQFKRGFVETVSGTTVTLSDPPDVPAASGAVFWSTFGAVYVTNSYAPALDDITVNNAWGAFLIDDPNATSDTYKGVTRGNFTRLSTTVGRMFGFVKGRNAQVGLASHLQMWGGWQQIDTLSGTGSQTNFPISFFINLTRELNSVKVNGVTQVLGTDFTINSNGLGITFGSAPASGASIVLNYYTDGGDGYVDDCHDLSVVCGGNSLTDSNILAWDDGIYCDKCQGMVLSSVVSDNSVRANLVFDGNSSAAPPSIANMGLF